MPFAGTAGGGAGMMAGSHVALGAAAWVAAAPLLGASSLSPVALGLAVTGSLLPDLDHPKSWMGKRLRPVSHLLSAVFGHRGVTHSLLAVVACTALLLRQGLPREVVAPLAVGYLSHLAADLLTPGGLRLAWPFRGTWALPLCRTGSPMEPLVVAALLCGAGWNALSRPEVGNAWRDAGLCRAWSGGVPACRPAPAAVRRPPSPNPRLAAPLRPAQGATPTGTAL